MDNEINKRRLKMAKCSECPFVCKGQLYCTRDNVVMEYDIKTVGSLNELGKKK